MTGQPAPKKVLILISEYRRRASKRGPGHLGGVSPELRRGVPGERGGRPGGPPPAPRSGGLRLRLSYPAGALAVAPDLQRIRRAPEDGDGGRSPLSGGQGRGEASRRAGAARPHRLGASPRRPPGGESSSRGWAWSGLGHPGDGSGDGPPCLGLSRRGPAAGGHRAGGEARGGPGDAPQEDRGGGPSGGSQARRPRFDRPAAPPQEVGPAPGGARRPPGGRDGRRRRLGEIAEALERAEIPAGLAVATGRNEALRRRLERRRCADPGPGLRTYRRHAGADASPATWSSPKPGRPRYGRPWRRVFP